MIRAVDRVLPTPRNLRWKMNKWMVASVSLLLAGATAVPALAQETQRWEGDSAAEPGDVSSTESQQPARSEAQAEVRADMRSEGRIIGRPVPPPEGREVVREERTVRQEWQGDALGQPGDVGAGVAPRQQTQPRAYQRRNQNTDQRYDNRYGNRSGYGYDNRYDSRYDNRYESRYDDRHDDRYDDRYDNRYDDRYDNRYDNRSGYDNRYNGNRYDVSRYLRHDDRRWNGNQWYPQYRYRAPVRYVHPRGYRAYQWQVGHRLPSSYYGSNYYVDYNAYRLPPPPYGYHWVRVDRDVVLVSIASGLIRDILYGLYF